jgi:hypothetical protein
MGQVTVKFSGSFGDHEASYSAEEGGHAYAISRALGFLMVRLSSGIRLDHKLHREGIKPESSDFGTKAPK